jgi:hypothetical protein
VAQNPKLAIVVTIAFAGANGTFFKGRAHFIEGCMAKPDSHRNNQAGPH